MIKSLSLRYYPFRHCHLHCNLRSHLSSTDGELLCRGLRPHCLNLQDIYPHPSQNHYLNHSNWIHRFQRLIHYRLRNCPLMICFRVTSSLLHLCSSSYLLPLVISLGHRSFHLGLAVVSLWSVPIHRNFHQSATMRASSDSQCCLDSLQQDSTFDLEAIDLVTRVALNCLLQRIQTHS